MRRALEAISIVDRPWNYNYGFGHVLHLLPSAHIVKETSLNQKIILLLLLTSPLKNVDVPYINHWV